MEESPEPQEQAEQVTHDEQLHEDQSASNSHQDEQMVPLSVVKKERKKRQQLQERIDHYEKQNTKPSQEDDRYEVVTREELGKTKFETLRDMREYDYADKFPDRAKFVEQELEDFLHARPNLAPAIQNSPNRIQEAYELMTALSPKQREREKAASKPNDQVPRSPTSIPKAAALNEAIDVMNMSDNEFRQWRDSKRRR